MDRFVDLHDLLGTWLQVPAKTHRVNLDAVQLEILAFSTRFAATQIRRGHCASPSATPNKAARRLLEKLEILRKRAVRLWKNSTARSSYSELQSRWHNFMPWLRGHAVLCVCHFPKLDSTRRKYRKLVIETCERLARQVIEENGLVVPAPRDLRLLVRRFIRYAHVGRESPGFRDIARANEKCRYALGRFLSARLAKNKQNHQPRSG